MEYAGSSGAGDELFSIKQMADLLCVTPMLVSQQIARGRIAAFRKGSRIFIARTEVERYDEARKITRKSPINKAVRKRGYAEIELSLRGHPNVWTKVDLHCLDSVLEHRWRFHNSGYAISGDSMMMHRFLLGVHGRADSRELVVDHINGDRLDNRKANLRLVSPSENTQNRRRATAPHRGEDAYPGVYEDTRSTEHYQGATSRWCAEFSIRTKIRTVRKQKHFRTREEAIAQRQRWEAEYGRASYHMESAPSAAPEKPAPLSLWDAF